MPYGTVKVDNIIFDNGGADQNVTVSGIHRAITSGVTVTGTISGAVLIGTTTVSGATVTGTTVQGTTVQGVSGTFTSLTGTTTTGTTANFVFGVFTTHVSGTIITGNTGQFTSGTFVSLTGTTITGTTVNALTVSSTTGTFDSITGTTITGTTINGTTVNSTTGNFTSLTGVTVTGTTANFISGIFTTQISGLTVTGTQSSFTSGNFIALSGDTVTGTQSSFTSGNFIALSGNTATFTSGVIASGTVAAPSLSILGDLNTGIYSPGADQLAITTNGNGRLFIDNNGRILVNTSAVTPVNTPRVCVATSSIESSFSLAQYRNSASISADLDFIKSRSGIIGTTVEVTNGDSIGALRFYGAGDASTYVEAAKIQVVTDGGTVGPTSLAGRIVFFTTPNGTSTPIERLRITSAGLVGIGTSAPLSLLHIQGTSGTYPTATLNHSVPEVEGEILRIGRTDATTRYHSITSQQSATAGGATNYIAFKIHNVTTTTAQTEVLRLTGNGRVGIGTTSPDALLTVNGIGAFGAGTVTTPSISATGDLNTGFWFPASDTIAASTAGNERLRITSAGVLQITDASDIAVGTTTGTKIGTATTQKLGFYNATPVVQPTAVANATDAATAITQLNSLLAKLRTLGIIAT